MLSETAAAFVTTSAKVEQFSYASTYNGDGTIAVICTGKATHSDVAGRLMWLLLWSRCRRSCHAP